MPAPVCSIVPQYNGSGVQIGECVSCPEVPFVAAVPGRTIVDPNYGWNSSAISAISRDGDCYTQFQMLPSVGTAVGFTNARVSNGLDTLRYAFICYRDGAAAYWRVVERGIFKTAPVAHDPDVDVFRIERRASVVRYFVNGRQVYEAALLSGGSLIIVGCMYAAGDGVN